MGDQIRPGWREARFVLRGYVHAGMDDDEAALALVRAAALSIEWGDNFRDYDLCPQCGRNHPEGHAPDCALAAAIREEP